MNETPPRDPGDFASIELELAEAGERDMVRAFMARFRWELHKPWNCQCRNPPERNPYIIGPDQVVVSRYLYDFVAEVFGRILRGDDPQTALFGKQPGRPGRTTREQERRWWLALCVHEIRSKDHRRGSLKRAILTVMSAHEGIRGERFTYDQVRDAYREHFPNGGRTR